MKGHLTLSDRHGLAVILLVALALMLQHIGGAFGGYHGFNEAFYTRLAGSIAENPLSYPRLPEGRADYNIPPLLAYLLGYAFILFGEGEAVARMVPVAFSLLAVASTYLIGRRLYGGRTGLAAAAILSVTPMHFIVGRNVQTDMVFVALGLTAVYLYLRGSVKAAGAVLGLGFLAKQPAALYYVGLLAYEVWRTHDSEDRRGTLKKFAVFTACAAAVAAPYIIYNLVNDPGGFLGGQTRDVMLASTGGPGLFALASEAYNGLSPLTTLAFIAGVILVLRKRERDLTLIYTALFAVFFLFYNFHSYYALPLAAFAALAAARACSGIPSKKLRLAAILLLYCAGLFNTALMMCANKYGYEEFRRLPRHIPEQDAVLVASDVIERSYLPVLQYYADKEVVAAGGYDVEAGEMYPLDYSKPTYALIHRSEVDLGRLTEQHRQRLVDNGVYADVHALALGGVVFHRPPINPHFFTNGPLQVEWLLPPTSYGVVKVGEVPEVFAVKLRPSERLYRSDRGGYSIR